MSKYLLISILFFILNSFGDKINAGGKDTVSILFMGDIMQHYSQLKSALKDDDSLSSASYDYSSYFKYIEDRIKEADYAIANMEFVLGAVPYTGHPDFSAPISILEETKRAGVDLFLCANNHICDKGRRGLKTTFSAYSQLGASYTGVYENRADEIKNNPFVIEIKGIKIAFINFSYGTNGRIPEPYVVNIADASYVKTAIIRAQKLNPDIIIALPHWGIEYSLKSSRYQKGWRDFLFNNGVYVIVGTHPHVIQPIEVKHNSKGDIKSIVAYSLGNLISNMSRKHTQLGLLFSLDLTKNENNNLIIADLDYEFTWCARKGDIIDNYTTIPVEDFLGKKDLFLNKAEYEKMKSTYFQVLDSLKLNR